MTNVFFNIITKFGKEVGIEDTITQAADILFGAVIILAIQSCFFGLKLFRIISGIMAFFLTAIGICALLQPTADMGVIVTTFSLIGLIVAFLAYHWYKLSVFIISALIGYSLTSLFTANILICLGTGIVLGAVSVVFSSTLVTLSTAVWGAVTLGFEGLVLLGVNNIAFQVIASAILTAAGIMVQHMMSNQPILFKRKKRYTGRHAAKKHHSNRGRDQHIAARESRKEVNL
ncbi:MAG: hypothetical protein ACOX8Q_07465 [Christensenellales bacterium]|jgi:hypothetical protein